jgi:hypothetical protein
MGIFHKLCFVRSAVIKKRLVPGGVERLGATPLREGGLLALLVPLRILQEFRIVVVAITHTH